MKLLVYISMRLCRKTWLAVAMSCLVYILPFCGVLRMMLPFFWLGYAAAMSYEKINLNKGWFMTASFIAFVVAVCIWSPTLLSDCYNLIEFKLQDVVCGSIPMFVIGGVGVRMFVAIAFSVFFLSLCHCVNCIPRWVQYIGSSTLGIYIIQTVVVEALMPRWLDISNVVWRVRDLLISPILSVLLVAACWGLYWILSRNKYLSLVLFGK